MPRQRTNKKAVSQQKVSRKPKKAQAEIKRDYGGIVIEGDLPEIERCPTGLYGLDVALNGGLPLRSMYEVAGATGVGKSTLTYFLAGRIASAVPNGTIALADFEGLNRDYLAKTIAPSGFSGKVRLVPITEGKKPASAETMLDKLSGYFMEKDTAAGIVDSVGAIVPIAEVEAKIDDAQVGLRARLMAKFSRMAIYQLRMKEVPAAIFLVNHVHMVIGGRGSLTSGGVAIGYLSSVRLRIWTDKGKLHEYLTEANEDGSYMICCSVDKHRYGPKPNNTVHIYVKSNYGVHPGLSAVVSAIELELASKDKVVTMNGKSYGAFSRLNESADDPEVFEPFITALQEYQG